MRPRVPWPSKLVLGLTNRCNFHCRICRPHTDRPYPDLDMPEAIFARLEPAARHAREIVLAGSGEPTLAAGYLERTARLHAWSPRATRTIFTNGSLLHSDAVLDNLERSFERLHISINSWGLYDEVSGGGHRERLEQALRLVAERRRRTGRPAHVELGFVLMRCNLPDIVPIAELTLRHGFDRVAYKDLLVTRELLRSESLHHDPALAPRIRAEIVRARGLGVPIRCEPWPELSTPWLRPSDILRDAARAVHAGRLWPRPSRLRLACAILGDRLARRWYWARGGETPLCRAPWELATVLHDGRLLLCCCGDSLIGRLDRESFEAAWFGETATRYREGLLTGALYGACATCNQAVPAGPEGHEYLTAAPPSDLSGISF